MSSIGPKMSLAVQIVELNGGVDVPNRLVCNAVNPCPIPSRAEAHGYNPVNRAVSAGLLIRYTIAGKRGSFLRLP